MYFSRLHESTYEPELWRTAKRALNDCFLLNTLIMRSIWTGAIGFGLVNIPIKMYSATERSELNLDMLDKNDHSRIKYQRINEQSGKPVDWDAIVKVIKWKTSM
jgi:DNA end-binding protein Ku